MSNSVWQIQESDFPTNGSIEEKIKFWLGYAILAPSAHNTQPWTYKIDGNVVTVKRDPDHTLKVGDPTLRETFLGLGAFIENFVTAASHWKYRATVTYTAHHPQDLDVATISLSEGGSLSDTQFTGITKRHTNRGLFQSDIDEVTLSTLKVESEDGIELFFITEPEMKAEIGALVARGTHIALSMRPMKEEMAELVSRHHEAKPTGMTVESMTETQTKSDGKTWTLQEMNGQKEGHANNNKFATAPVICVVASEYDDPEAWLKAGRVMERVLLTAATHNLVHDISAAPVEIPTLLPLLRQKINPELRPQALFRLGTPQNPDFTHNSNRRPVE